MHAQMHAEAVQAWDLWSVDPSSRKVLALIESAPTSASGKSRGAGNYIVEFRARRLWQHTYGHLNPYCMFHALFTRANRCEAPLFCTQQTCHVVTSIVPSKTRSAHRAPKPTDAILSRLRFRTLPVCGPPCNSHQFTTLPLFALSAMHVDSPKRPSMSLPYNARDPFIISYQLPVVRRKCAGSHPA